MNNINTYQKKYEQYKCPTFYIILIKILYFVVKFLKSVLKS